jgi:hypothetical protein
MAGPAETLGGEIVFADFSARLAEAGITFGGTGAGDGTRFIATQIVLDTALTHAAPHLRMNGRDPLEVAEAAMGVFSSPPLPDTLRAMYDERARNTALCLHPAVQLAGSIAMEGIGYGDVPEAASDAIIALSIADHRGLLPGYDI